MKLKLTTLLFFIFLFVQNHAQKVERIVSLAPSVTKNIYQMGADDMLVGCTSFCTEAVADSIEVVATAIKVNIEKTISLKPDLILAAEITTLETIELFRKMGVRVEVFSSPASFDELCKQFIEMGNLIGRSNEAKLVVNQAKMQIEKLLSEQEELPQRDVFFQIGANPLFTVLPNTFMNDYITMTGGRNIADDMNRGIISRESVVTRNPDLIIIVTMGIAGNEEKSIWQNFSDLSAAKSESIFIIDAEKACTPTPLTFVETLDTLFKLIKNN